MHRKFTTFENLLLLFKGEISQKINNGRVFHTNPMIADYFTKPLQGKDFSIFCDVIMGYSNVDTLLTEDIPIKRRVKKVTKVKLLKINSPVYRKLILR